MSSEVDAILKLEVPIIVRLGERRLRVDEVLSLAIGSIIELSKSADEPLDILVNNMPIGSGVAVKIGENFGVRVEALGAGKGPGKPRLSQDDGGEEADDDALVRSLLEGHFES